VKEEAEESSQVGIDAGSHEPRRARCPTGPECPAVPRCLVWLPDMPELVRRLAFSNGVGLSTQCEPKMLIYLVS